MNMSDWPVVLEPVARSVPSTVMQSRACERELCWFIWVPKVILFLRAVARILTKTRKNRIKLKGYPGIKSEFWLKDCTTFLMCWKLLTSMTLRPGTCSCPVPSGLILMSSFSPSLLSRSLNNKQIIKQITSISYNCPNEDHCTLAPHYRSPQSWLWPCKTTCPSAARFHRTDVLVLACWCLGSPRCPEKSQDA